MARTMIVLSSCSEGKLGGASSNSSKKYEQACPVRTKCLFSVFKRCIIVKKKIVIDHITNQKVKSKKTNQQKTLSHSELCSLILVS